MNRKKDIKFNSIKSSAFISNVKDSIKYTAEDVGRDLMPLAFDIADTNSDLGSSVKEALGKISPKQNFKRFKSNGGMEEVKDILKTIKTDFKSGNFNKRISSEDDFDFDFGDFDFGNNSSSGNSINIFNGTSDTGNLSDTIKTSTSTQIKLGHKQAERQMAVLNTINDNISKLVSFNINNTAKHYEETAKFYSNMHEMTSEIKNRLVGSSNGGGGFLGSDRERTALEKVLGYDSFDVKEYIGEIFKKNIPSILSEMTMSTSDLMFSMYDKDMGSGMLDQFKQNPLGTITSTIVKKSIPTFFKDSLETFQNSLSNIAKTFAMQMNTLASGEELGNLALGITPDGSFKSVFSNLIGKIFKLDHKQTDVRVNKAKYLEENRGFDAMARKSIIEVIPMYLRKILSTLQGSKDEIVYDYSAGEARWSSQLFKEEEQKRINREFASLNEMKRKTMEKLSETYNDIEFDKSFKKDLSAVIKNLSTKKLPKLNNEYEMELFKNGLDVDSEDNLYKILGAMHNLSAKDKLKIASLGFEAQNDKRSYVKDLESRFEISGLSQIKGTEKLKSRESKDYLDAVDKEDAKAILKLDNKLGSSESILFDIRKILLQGIDVRIKGSDVDLDSSRKAELDLLSKYQERYDSIIRDINYSKSASKDFKDFILKRNKENNPNSKSLDEDFYMSQEDASFEMYMNGLSKEDNKKSVRTPKGFFGKFHQLLTKPFQSITNLMDKFTNKMSDMFFGSNKGKDGINLETDEFGNPVNGTNKIGFKEKLLKKLDFITESFQGIKNKTKEFFDKSVKPQLDKFKEMLFGNDEKDGFFTKYINSIKDTGKGILNFITGNEYTLSDGTIIKQNGENSLKSIFGKFKTDFSEFVFGKKGEDGVIEKDGILKSFGISIKSSLNDLSTMLFGKSIGKPNQELTDSFKDYLPHVTAGTSLGLLASLFLPGGPLLYGVIGGLTGMAKKTGLLNKVLYGDLDENGNVIEGSFQGIMNNPSVKNAISKIKEFGFPTAKGAGLGLIGSMFLPGGPLLGMTVGGLLSISKKTGFLDNVLFGNSDKANEYKEKFNKFLPSGIKGAGIGLLGSIFLPGGPLLGMTIGTLGSMATKSSSLKEALFGKDDDKDSSKFKEEFVGKLRDFGIKGLKIGGFGILGSLLLPGGPLLGGLIGTFVGSKLTKDGIGDKINRYLWGDFDPEKGTGRIGQIQMLGMALRSSIVIPFQRTFNKVGNELRYFFEKEMLIPLRSSMKPIFTAINYKVKEFFKDNVKDPIGKLIVKPITETVHKIFEPLRVAMSKAAKLLLSPFKFLAKGLIKLPMMLVDKLADKASTFNSARGIGGNEGDRATIRENLLRESKERYEARSKVIKEKNDRLTDEKKNIDELISLQMAKHNLAKNYEKRKNTFINSADENDYSALEEINQKYGVKISLKKDGSIDHKAVERQIRKSNRFKDRITKGNNKDTYNEAVLQLNEKLALNRENRSEEFNEKYGAFDPENEDRNINERMKKLYKMVGGKSEAQAELEVQEESKQAKVQETISDSTTKTVTILEKIYNFITGKDKTVAKNTSNVDIKEAETNEPSAVGDVVEGINKFNDATKKDERDGNPEEKDFEYLQAMKDKKKASSVFSNMNDTLSALLQTTRDNFSLFKERFGGSFFGKILKLLPIALPFIMKGIKSLADFARGGLKGLLVNSVKPGGFLHNFANKTLSKVLQSAISSGLVSGIKGLFTKGAKGVANKVGEAAIGATVGSGLKASLKEGVKHGAGNIVKDGLGQIAKTKIGSILNNKLVQSVVGKESIKKLSKTGIGKILGKAGGKVLGKVGGALVAAPVTAAFVATDLITGMNEANSIFKLPKGEKPTFKMRIASGLGKAISNNLTFGLLPPSSVAKGIFGLLSDNKQMEQLEEMQERFYNEASASGMSVDDYNESINQTFGQKLKATLFGKTKKTANGEKVQIQRGILNPFSWFRQKEMPKPVVANGAGARRQQRNNLFKFDGRGAGDQSLNRDISISRITGNTKREKEQKFFNHLNVIASALIAIAHSVVPANRGKTLLSVVKKSSEDMVRGLATINSSVRTLNTNTVEAQKQTAQSSDSVISKAGNAVTGTVKTIASGIISGVMANPVLAVPIAGAITAGVRDIVKNGLLDSAFGKLIGKTAKVPLKIMGETLKTVDKRILGDNNITESILYPMKTYLQTNKGMFLNKKQKALRQTAIESGKLRKVKMGDVLSKRFTTGDFGTILEDVELENSRLARGSKKVRDTARRIADKGKDVINGKDNLVAINKEIESLNAKSLHGNHKKIGRYQKRIKELEDRKREILDARDVVSNLTANKEQQKNKAFINRFFEKVEQRKEGKELPNRQKAKKVLSGDFGNNKYIKKVMGIKDKVKLSDRSTNVDELLSKDGRKLTAREILEARNKSNNRGKYFDGVLDKLDDIDLKGKTSGKLGKLANSTSGVMKNFTQKFGGVVKNLSSSVSSASKGILNSVKGFAGNFKGLTGVMNKSVKFFADSTKGIFNGLKGSLSGLLGSLKGGALTNAIGMSKGLIGNGMASLGGMLGKIPGMGKLGGLVGGGMKAIAGSGALSSMAGLLGPIAPLLGPLLPVILGGGAIFALNKFGPKIEEFMDNLPQNLSNMIQKIGGFLIKGISKLPSLILSAGKQLIKIVAKLPMTIVKTIATVAKDLIGKAVDFINPFKRKEKRDNELNGSQGQGSGRGKFKSIAKKALAIGTAGMMAFNPLSMLARQVAIPDVNKSITKSLSNPIIKSVSDALIPIYGDASPIIAPALVGLTLRANDKVIETLNKARKSSSSGIENNQAVKQMAMAETVSQPEKKDKKWYEFWKWGKGSSKNNFRSYNGRGSVHGQTYFNQNDPRWANQDLSSGGDGDTVADAGCGPTAVAMALSSRGVNTDPSQASAFAKGYKLQNKGVTADFISDYAGANGVGLQGRTVDNYTQNDIDLSLASGRPVVSLGHSGSGGNPYTSEGHYVMISGKDNKGNYLVSDPMNESNNYKSFSPKDMLNNTSVYWTDNDIDGSTMGDYSSLFGEGGKLAVNHDNVVPAELENHPSRSGSPTTKVGRIIQHMVQRIGAPYLYGGNYEPLTKELIRQKRNQFGSIVKTDEAIADQYAGMRVSDCSNITYKAYLSEGYDIGRSTSPQANVGREIRSTDKRPGDLHVTSGSHVVGYIGEGYYVEYPSANRLGHITKSVGRLKNWRRVLPDSEVPKEDKIPAGALSQIGTMNGAKGTEGIKFFNKPSGSASNASSTDTSTSGGATSGGSTSGGTTGGTTLEDILAGIQNVFTTAITGKSMTSSTEETSGGSTGGENSSFASGGVSSGISNASFDYPNSGNTDIWASKTTNRRGDGGIIEMSAYYEVGGTNPGYISSGKGDHGGKSYGLPQFTYKGNGVAGEGSLKNSFMPYLEKNKSRFPNIWRSLSRYKVYSNEFDNNWRELGKTHANEFSQVQSELAERSYYDKIRKQLENKGYEVGKQPKAIHSAILSRGVQINNLTDDLFEQGAKLEGMTLKEANKYPGKLLHGVYQAQYNNVDKNFRSSSKAIRDGLRKRRFSMTHKDSEYNYAKEILERESRGEIYRKGQQGGATSGATPQPSGRGLARSNKVSHVTQLRNKFGRGSDAKLERTTAQSSISNYMQETANKINRTLDVDFISQNLNIAINKVLDVLYQIADNTKETAINTKDISENIEITNINNQETGDSNLTVNNNTVKQNPSVNANNENFFMGNHGVSRNDPHANLKSKILQLAKG